MYSIYPPVAARDDIDDIRMLQGKLVRFNIVQIFCCCKRDKIVLRYYPLPSRCFIKIVFTQLVIGDDDDTMEVLQLINHSSMVDLLAKQQQDIQTDTAFE